MGLFYIHDRVEQIDTPLTTITFPGPNLFQSRTILIRHFSISTTELVGFHIAGVSSWGHIFIVVPIQRNMVVWPTTLRLFPATRRYIGYQI
jgi:hypothetical protein